MATGNEFAAEWLQRAADQDHEDRKRELEQLGFRTDWVGLFHFSA